MATACTGISVGAEVVASGAEEIVGASVAGMTSASVGTAVGAVVGAGVQAKSASVATRATVQKKKRGFIFLLKKMMLRGKTSHFFDVLHIR